MVKKFIIWLLINLLIIALSCTAFFFIISSNSTLLIIFGTIGVLIASVLLLNKSRKYQKDELDGTICNFISNGILVLYAVAFIAMIFLKVSLLG